MKNNNDLENVSDIILANNFLQDDKLSVKLSHEIIDFVQESGYSDVQFFMAIEKIYNVLNKEIGIGSKYAQSTEQAVRVFKIVKKLRGFK